MSLTSDDFYQQLQALLPPGPAWDMEQAAVASQLLQAWAEELVRIFARAQALVEEADPRTTLELLADYERIFGLPTDCMAGLDQTIEQRHQALVAQMTSIGGQSRAYFIALAAALGYTVTITEFTPHTFLSDFNYPFYGTDWWFAWQVNGVGLGAVSYFTFVGGFNEPFASWGTSLLQCVFGRLKPAHTVVIYV